MMGSGGAFFAYAKHDVVIEQQQDQRRHLVLRLVTEGLLWLTNVADFQPVEGVVSGLVAYWAALLLLAPGLFTISHTYDVMAVVASQNVWGCGAALIICWHSFSVVFWRRHQWTRSAALLMITAWNVFVGLMFTASGVPSYGAGLHFYLAILTAWVLWRYAGRPHA